MSIPKNAKMLPNAKALRRKMTPQERKLWYLFLRNYPVKFYKQRIIRSFIADFYCASAHLVIEIDGNQHHSEQGAAYDAERTAILQAYDLQVLRFCNRDIDYYFPGVCEKIHAVVAQRREKFR